MRGTEGEEERLEEREEGQEEEEEGKREENGGDIKLVEGKKRR